MMIFKVMFFATMMGLMGIAYYHFSKNIFGPFINMMDTGKREAVEGGDNWPVIGIELARFVADHHLSYKETEQEKEECNNRGRRWCLTGNC